MRVIYKTPNGEFIEIDEPTPRERRILKFLKLQEYQSSSDFIRNMDVISNEEFLSTIN